MIYATKEDLALWLGYEDINGDPDVVALPENAGKLLRNASRVVDQATMQRINADDTRHLEIAKNATTSQVEYWIDGVGESADINPKIEGYTAGKTSVNFQNGIPKLAPRARRELWLGGLLNRTVIRI